MLTPAEWEQIWHHVSTCDFRETAAVWCELGREAGFGAARQVFDDRTDLYRLVKWRSAGTGNSGPALRLQGADVVVRN